MFVAKPEAEQAGFRFWKPLVWDKCTIGMGYHYRARYEFILFFEKGKRRLNDLGIADIITVPRIRGGYPAEKPADVADVLIRQSSNAGDVVCDPFMVRRAAPVSAFHWVGVAFTLLAAAVWLQFGGPWSVAIWATEGAVAFWIALKADRQWLRAGAWVLFGLAVFRWAQQDIQATTLSYEVLFNARALTGLYLVTLLYLAAWVARRSRQGTSKSSDFPACSCI